MGWEVILRKEDDRQVVLYNPVNREVAVNSVGTPDVRTEDDDAEIVIIENGAGKVDLVRNGESCPYCGGVGVGGTGAAHDVNAWSRGSSSGLQGSNEFKNGFMATNYFRLLERSVHNESGDGADSEGLGNEALNEGYYSRFFFEERKLGSGAKGSVYLCQHIMDNVHLGHYALKKVPVGNNHEWLVNILREVRILEGLHHPNIIEYKHTWLEKAKLCDFGAEVPCLFVLMEYANSGNLIQYMVDDSDRSDEVDGQLGETAARRHSKRRRLLRELKRRKKAHRGSQAETNASDQKLRILPERLIWKFLLDILAGLDHLHSHGIVHRDIKPQNLLLYMDENSEIPRVLLSDFGECEFLSCIDVSTRTGGTGTVEFVAPELLAMSSDGEFFNRYDKRCDVWSIGVVLYQMMYSKLPWRSGVDQNASLIEEIQHFNNVLPPEGDVRRSTELRLLLKTILVRNPRSRPTARDLFSAVTQHLANIDSGKIPLSPLFSPHSSREVPELLTNFEFEDNAPFLLDTPIASQQQLQLIPIGGEPESFSNELNPHPKSSFTKSMRVMNMLRERLRKDSIRVDHQVFIHLVLSVIKLYICLRLTTLLPENFIIPFNTAEAVALSLRINNLHYALLTTGELFILLHWFGGNFNFNNLPTAILKGSLPIAFMLCLVFSIAICLVLHLVRMPNRTRFFSWH